MIKALKDFKWNVKHTLVVISIVAFFLTAALVTPLTTDDASAAIWRAKVNPSITMTLNSSEFTVGTKVHADCVLKGTYGLNNAKIALKVTLPDGSASFPVQGQSIYTGSYGRFSIDYVPTTGGEHKLSATFSGNNYYASATKTASFVAGVPSPIGTAKISTTMTMSAASSSVQTGTNIHADGHLSGVSAVANTAVSLTVTLPDGSKANPAQGASTMTDSAGMFAIDYVPATPGAYKLTASFAGNDQYAGSSVNSSVTVSETATTPSTPSTPSVPSTPAPAATYKYIVTAQGSTYYAKDANTGATIASGTNAATVINKALNSLTAGRTVKEAVLLQGTFTVTSGISMPNYGVLEVASGGQITLTSGGLVYANGKSNFEIVGGDWNKNGASGCALEFDSCTNVVIKNLKVHDGAYDNMALTGCSYVTISNVESYNAGHTALVFGWSSNCIVENCYLHDSKTGGGCYFICEDASVENINNNILRNNLVERVPLTGLSISPRGLEDIANNNIIEGNTVIDCGTDGTHPGINMGWADSSGIRYGTNGIIRNNTVYETGAYYGAGGTGGGINCCGKNCLVTNNVIHDTTDVALYLAGDYNTVSYNKISGVRTTFYPGIEIEDGNHNELVGNDISNCVTGIGIYATLTSGSSYNHIANNHFETISSNMVLINDGGSTGNTIENNNYKGTWRVSNRGTGTTIVNNVPAP